ncbi:hypothetical protein ACNKHR_19815 [Shigella flexneri]
MYCVVSFVAQCVTGDMLGAKETFFYKLVGPLIALSALRVKT